MFRANESVSVVDYTISLNSEILDRSRVNKLSEMGCRSRLIEATPGKHLWGRSIVHADTEVQHP